MGSTIAYFPGRTHSTGFWIVCGPSINSARELIDEHGDRVVTTATVRPATASGKRLFTDKRKFSSYGYNLNSGFTNEMMGRSTDSRGGSAAAIRNCRHP